MLSRLRSGEWLAVGGLVGLLVTLFLEWFRGSADLDCTGDVAPQFAEVCAQAESFTSTVATNAGWGALGRPWADFLVIVVVLVVLWLVMTLRAGPGRPTYGAVVSLIVAGAVTALVTLLTVIRVVLARPSELTELTDDISLTLSTSIGPGGWIGMASLIVLLIGLWVAVADDRTDAADSVFDPPAPRPVPDPAPRPVADGPAPPPEA